jgi:hypothetical protein
MRVGLAPGTCGPRVSLGDRAETCVLSRAAMGRMWAARRV